MGLTFFAEYPLLGFFKGSRQDEKPPGIIFYIYVYMCTYIYIYIYWGEQKK